ncbi:hypothetical protein O1611_g5766 [Lasiodiplodia mahajangana]|uniref:Uncharacterized protein n=1 Tax=Lasiodiplodia mahajangana TaxID=1108764 RepID=A0ACC2JKL1_9PEZI|nr:hypothetical protein O1611_g5766 [Lasiodiplodia mahajangana]
MPGCTLVNANILSKLPCISHAATIPPSTKVLVTSLVVTKQQAKALVKNNDPPQDQPLPKPIANTDHAPLPEQPPQEPRPQAANVHKQEPQAPILSILQKPEIQAINNVITHNANIQLQYLDSVIIAFLHLSNKLKENIA